MTNYQKLILEHSRILGEFQGTLKAVLCWDVPQELKDKIQSKIKELEEIKVDHYIEDSLNEC